MNHKVINALDLPSFKMTPFFEEAFEFIDQAITRGNILVHCAAGISRVRVRLFSQLPLLLSTWWELRIWPLSKLLISLGLNGQLFVRMMDFKKSWRDMRSQSKEYFCPRYRKKNYRIWRNQRKFKENRLNSLNLLPLSLPLEKSKWPLLLTVIMSLKKRLGIKKTKE